MLHLHVLLQYSLTSYSRHANLVVDSYTDPLRYAVHLVSFYIHSCNTYAMGTRADRIKCFWVHKQLIINVNQYLVATELFCLILVTLFHQI